MSRMSRSPSSSSTIEADNDSTFVMADQRSAEDDLTVFFTSSVASTLAFSSSAIRSQSDSYL